MHKLPYQAVLFDLDGTLIDTALDFVRIIQTMCQELGRPLPSAELIRSQVSEGGRAMVHLIYPELALDSEALWQHRQTFLDRYYADIVVDTQLFEGMDKLLQDLEQKQIPWGIVTNKPRWLTEPLLVKLDLTRRCAVLVCPEDVSKTKPDPEPMYLAASQLNLPAEQIIYVGDHPRDIDAGRNAKMPTILAAYGYLPPEAAKDLSAWQADYIAEDVAALAQCITELI